MPRPGASDGAPAPPEPGPGATLSVPDIRDYDLINKELARLLGAGERRIVLSGVEGQRLLGARLRGDWVATILVQGHAGPELAAEMDAPGLTVLCRGDAADGAGRGLFAGRLIVEGDAGDGLGYAQRGGTILIRGGAGHRAGLMQSGGSLVILGAVGRLAGERQSGGLLVVPEDRTGLHAGRGRLGGRVVRLGPGRGLPTHDLDALESALAALA